MRGNGKKDSSEALPLSVYFSICFCSYAIITMPQWFPVLFLKFLSGV